MATFTTITNSIYFHALRDDAVEAKTLWTINKTARVGDEVLLYVCAPVSAIVATAQIAEPPFEETNPQSEFFRSYFAEMNELKLLDFTISRHQLRTAFPFWKYWVQPHQSVRVPDEILPKLRKMLAHESIDEI